MQQASNESNEDQGLFASALGFLNGRDNDDDVDEQRVQQAHQQAYSPGQSNMSADSMGAAAAMQALKSFTSGSGGQQSGGGGMQSKLIAMGTPRFAPSCVHQLTGPGTRATAMSEAVKLFNSNGGAANGGKQDVVNSAAQVRPLPPLATRFSSWPSPVLPPLTRTTLNTSADHDEAHAQGPSALTRDLGG